MTKHTFVDLLQFIEQKAWIAENFPRDRRFENLILASDNVLTADTVKYVRNQKRTDLEFPKFFPPFSQFVKIDEKIRSYVSPKKNLTLEDLCFRYPDLTNGGLSDCQTYGIFGVFFDHDLENITDTFVHNTITFINR